MAIRIGKQKEATATAWLLGFDGRCGRCTGAAMKISDLSEGKLGVVSLHNAQMKRWREEALGPNPPWVPTLVEVRVDRVRAWTGAGLTQRLVRLLGPAQSLEIARVLNGVESADHGIVLPGRRRFIQGMTGSAIGMAALAMGRFPRDVGAQPAPSWDMEPVSGSTVATLESSSDADPSFTALYDYAFNDPHWLLGENEHFRVYKNGSPSRLFRLQKFEGDVNEFLGVFYEIDVATGGAVSFGAHALDEYVLNSTLYVDGGVVQTYGGSGAVTSPGVALRKSSSSGASTGAAHGLRQSIDPTECEACTYLCDYGMCGLGCWGVGAAICFGTTGFLAAVCTFAWGTDCAFFCSQGACSPDVGVCCDFCGGSGCACARGDFTIGGCEGGSSGGGGRGFN